MHIPSKDVEDYVSQIPEERKPVFNKLIEIIRANIPAEFTEQLSYGMPGWVIPLSMYPEGYHCKADTPLPFASLASQKNFIALYHMGVYANPELYKWFTEEYAKQCKYKLDMGKSCVRLKKMDDIPFELIGELFKKISANEWIAKYESEIKK